MKFVVILLSIYAFLESTSYGIYEYQENQNKIRWNKYFYTIFHRTSSPYIQYFNLI